jgi:hypothetical protein
VIGNSVQDSVSVPSRYIAVRRSAYDSASETYVTEISLITAGEPQLCHGAERLDFEAALALSKVYAREHQTEHVSWTMESDKAPTPPRAVLHVGRIYGTPPSDGSTGKH